MTSIATTNPQEPHAVARSVPQPAIWRYPAAPATSVPAQPDSLAALDWPRWAPAKPLQREQMSKVLGQFAAEHPDRPLLMMAHGILLAPADARRLDQIAMRFSSPVVLSVLSNANPLLNPFAGLDVERTGPAADDDPGTGYQRLAGLVNLLGSGMLHDLDWWPDHLLYFSTVAIRALATGDFSFAHAHARLQDLGGSLLVADSLFAPAAFRALNAAADLAPHEQLRPAPWGDLTAKLDHYLTASAPWPDYPADAQRAVSLHITHSWGGGVAQWVESFIAADCQGINLQLRSEGPQSGQGAGQRLSLYAGNENKCPLASWWLAPPIRSASPSHEQYREILDTIQRRYGVGRVIVSSLVGHCLDALRTGLPTVQVLHDLLPAWPLLGVHPGPYLETAREHRLQQAMEQHELLADFRDNRADDWNRLADDWRSAVTQHAVRLIAPSQSVATLLRQLDNRWQDTNIEIVHHGVAPLPTDGPVLPRQRMDGKLRLVIPGRMQEGKGQSLLLAALPELTRYAHIYLLGAGQQGEIFFGKAGVNVILQYRRNDLPSLMQAIGPDLAALLSVVPETFSYTLSEMRQLGVPVVATRVGSLAERIHDGRDGWLIEPNAEALVEAVSKIAANRGLLDKIRTHLESGETHTTEDMVQQYNDICPALHGEPELDRRPGLADVQLAALAEQGARLEAVKRKLDGQILQLQAEVENRTEWALERDQALTDEQERRQRWVSSLEIEVQSGKDAVVREQAATQSAEAANQSEQAAHAQTRQLFRDLRSQHDMVLQSSSWRVTRPLRAGRRILANLSQARAWNPSRWPLLVSQAIRTVSTQGLLGAMLRLQQSSQPGQAPAVTLRLETATAENPEPPQLMPRAARPAVSIVIPVYNQWAYTAGCLRSIAQARNEAGFEVIVVDDHSTDETAQRLKEIDGLEWLHNENNVGFVGSCNRGAEAAKGRYILLLNNDTQVVDGWLDALLDTFTRFPDTGLAGARLVYPDGRLQEAGGIIFSDGSGWNYGKGDNAERPEYGFTREVDYCSGACVILPADLFRQLGGLDQRYAPAYYEDTDLAFKVREAGFKVRVQGAATVIHYEGITAGTDIASGTKRFQEINRKKFLDRWRAELAGYPHPIMDPNDQQAVRHARDHRLAGRVLIIDAYTPEPDQDSGSMRLRHLFDCFLQLGYGVTFFADNRGYASTYSADLQKSGIEVLFNPWIASLQDFFSSRGGEFDFIMISRHYVAANYISLIRKYCPQAKFIFDTVDLHYLREQRLAELENSLPLKRVAAQTRRSELAVVRQADTTLVVSPVEQSVLAKDAPGAPVHVLSNIHRIYGSGQDFAARKDLLFVGGFQHPPNIDAAQWFVNSIWPLIREQLPDLRFHLIGSKATDRVRALHGNGVEFHGFVQDLAPWLDGCRIALAPLRYGAGVKGKVNQSMSHGQPVVATPMAVEGLFARDGEDVLVATTAEEFAQAVIRLYQDEALWHRLAAGGLENVQRYFSLDRARENLKAILDSLNAT